MIYKSIKVGPTGICSPKFISLGKRGENKSTQITIDCSEYAGDEIYTYQVIYKRSDGIAYPLNCIAAENIVTVITTATELTIEGCGKAEIRLMQGEIIQKTCIFTTVVEHGIIGTDDPPAPDPEWFKDIVHSDGEVHPEGSVAVWNSNGDLGAMDYTKPQAVWHSENEQLEFIGL